MSVASWCCKSFCVVPCASFCTGHFVMVPLNMTCLHCLQHSLFVHLFNLYLFTPCFVMFCVFLYGPFCHGAHKLDLSTLFTTFFLWTSLPFILELSSLNVSACFNNNTRIYLQYWHYLYWNARKGTRRQSIIRHQTWNQR